MHKRHKAYYSQHLFAPVYKVHKFPSLTVAHAPGSPASSPPAFGTERSGDASDGLHSAAVADPLCSDSPPGTVGRICMLRVVGTCGGCEFQELVCWSLDDNNNMCFN